MYALRDGTYQSIDSSLALPVLTAAAVPQFAKSYRRTKWPAWVRSLREWIRENYSSSASPS